MKDELLINTAMENDAENIIQKLEKKIEILHSQLTSANKWFDDNSVFFKDSVTSKIMKFFGEE